MVISAHAIWNGGLLLHGALGEKDGQGVILAGQSGAGKTTASGRLQPPWTALSDDTTLVVRDKTGRYWAHPWPSLGELSEGIAQPRNVEHGVPLHGLFYLGHAEADSTARIGQGDGSCHVLDSVSQVMAVTSGGDDPEGEAVLRAFRARIFDNACSLVKSVPVYKLRLTLTGRFWELIEQVLEDECQPAKPR